MTIAYRFGPLSPAIEGAYQRLFPDDVDSKSQARLRWRFVNGPHGPGYFATAHDTAAADLIVGIVGLIATRMRVNGSDVLAYQAVDLVVDPAYRGRGIFNALGEALFQGAELVGARIVWGFPNENAAHTWFDRFKWNRFGPVPFLARPLRSSLFLRRLLPALRPLDVPLLIGPMRSLPNVRVVDRFGPEAAALWSAFSDQVGCALHRDSDLLNWRLIDQPDASYRTVAAFGPSNDMRALVSTTLRRKHNSHICYIMEAMSVSGGEKLLGRLLREEMARAAREGADLALAWCPRAAPNRGAFASAGFLPFPERLRPIQIFFGAKILDHSLANDAGHVNDWYISYIDSDTT